MPDRVLEPRGPFGKYEPEVHALEYDPDKFPPGATAQNGMKEVVMYECNLCGAILKETQLDGHTCEGVF